MKQFEEAIKSLEEKEVIRGEMHDLLNSNFFLWREEICRKSCFPFLHKRWINPLRKYLKNKKVLEIGAGTGALSKVLGVQRVTDNNSWIPKINWEPWIEIEDIDAISAISKYGKDIDVILFSWPIERDPLSIDCLRKMRVVNPSCLMLYIGEWIDGCTACKEFFEEAQEVFSEEISRIDTIYRNYRWRGIFDSIYLLK